MGSDQAGLSEVEYARSAKAGFVVKIIDFGLAKAFHTANRSEVADP